MTASIYELSRPVRVDELPSKGRYIDVIATAEERAAIAERLSIPELKSLEGQICVQPRMGREITVEGSIRADVVLSCVVTGADLAQTLEIDIQRRFSEEADFGDVTDMDSDDFDPNADDRDPIIDGKIDVGEVVVEELALQIPPYPRTPGTDFVDVAAAPKGTLKGANAPIEDETNTPEKPFAALAELKKKMESKE